jgi:hypothetical protein
MSDEKPNPAGGGPRLTLSAEVGLGQYANFVSIAHNYAEVLLDFARTLPGRDDIPVVARIIMSPFQAKQLLRALNHNVQMYEKTYGTIADPPKPPGDVPPGGTN